MTSMLLRDKLSIRCTTWLFSVAFEMLFDAKHHNSRIGTFSGSCDPHITTHPQFFGETWHLATSATSLLPRHGSVQLLSLPKTQNATQRKEISDYRRHQDQCDEATYGYSKKKASWSGSIAETSMLLQKGPISKGIRISTKQESYFSYFGLRSDHF